MRWAFFGEISNLSERRAHKRSALRRKRSLLHAASAAYLRRLITSTAAEAAVSARRSRFAREGAMRCAYCALRPWRVRGPGRPP